ncbi:MAG: hypothetical protein Q9214_006054 [Letrouitia sp. 1 TL-2023]
MPLRTRSRSPRASRADPLRAPSRWPVFICAAAEIILILGGAISSVPWTRLLESAVCRRHYVASGNSKGIRVQVAGSLADLLRGILAGVGPGAEMDETLCKGDNVQAEMAELMGQMSSFAIMPSLLLTIPYSILAKTIDRRIILVVNILSSLATMLFMIAIACYPKSNLRLLWLTGLFDFIGGGSPIFLTLLRSIIAESVEASRLSSVLYTLSSLHMIARLAGVIFGAWLMKNGAASAMLVGVTLTSTIIPILGFLPHSVARSPESENFQAKSTASSADCTSDNTSNIASPPLRPRQSNTKTSRGREQQINSHQERLMPTKGSRKAISHLIRRLSYIPFDNPLYLVFLAIMFLNGLAMDVRGQLRLWTSKRYNWPLATVGYILSVESFLGVGILFALPWLDRVRQRLPQSHPAGSRTTASGDVEPLAEDEAIMAAHAILAKRRREILVARVSLGLGVIGSLVLALTANRAAFFIGLATMTGAVGFPDAIRAFFTSYFATGDIQGLYASVTVVETLSVVVGSPIWGSIYAHAYRGTSAWLGAPFGVCAMLLTCTLGLALALRV